MHILTTICAIYLCSIWDLTVNHGAFVRTFGALMMRGLHNLGFF